MTRAAPRDPALELLRQVRALELAARRNVAGLLAGDWVTSVRGRGMLFHEARKYVPGDDTRHIDWKMTARMAEPYVRLHQDEREREVFVALDASPSMRTGWQERTKLEYAVELAATLALSAVEQRDRLGWIVFADRALEVSPPGRGRGRLFGAIRAFLRHLATPPAPCRESDPRAAIHAVQKSRGKRFALFLVSDFIDHDVPEDLKYVQARHDVMLLHVYDPLEYAPTGRVSFPARSPEGPGGVAAIRPGAAGDLASMQRFLATEAERYRIFAHSFPTTAPVGPALRDFFHRKRRLVDG